VYPFLAVLVAAAQPVYYEAKVTSYGCLSIKEVHELQGMRADVKAFQMAFVRKQVAGQCVTILKGTTVGGAVESADTSILRVNKRVQPPGYEAPLEDFKLKAADAKR
jgi:hypothetical protein